MPLLICGPDFWFWTFKDRIKRAKAKTFEASHPIWTQPLESQQVNEENTVRLPEFTNAGRYFKCFNFLLTGNFGVGCGLCVLSSVLQSRTLMF